MIPNLPSFIAQSSSSVSVMAPVLLLVFLAIGLMSIAFWVWMLVDCIQNEPSEGNDKIVWVVVIALTGWIGALIYFFARRPTRIAQLGR